MAQGLREVVDHDYLNYRIRSTAYLGDALRASGIPVLSTVGGHAAYIDARAMLPHIDALDYPGQALANALYEAGGVRTCEIGTVRSAVSRTDPSTRPWDMRAGTIDLQVPKLRSGTYLPEWLLTRRSRARSSST